MLPMALGLGEGGEQNAPLGRAVIGGLMFATVTTLFVVPIIYSYLRTKPPVDHLQRLAEREGVSPLMRYAEPDPPETMVSETTEDQLRRENRELQRQLDELKKPAHSGTPRNLWRPSPVTIWAIFLELAAVVVVAFLAGYIPLQKRRAVVAAMAHEEEQALPRVTVTKLAAPPDRADCNCLATSRPSPRRRFWRARTDMSNAAWWTLAIV